MNDITKIAAKSLSKPEPSLSRDIAKTSMGVGAGGIALVVAAGLIPFVGVLGLSAVLFIVGFIVFVLGS